MARKKTSTSKKDEDVIKSDASPDVEDQVEHGKDEASSGADVDEAIEAPNDDVTVADDVEEPDGALSETPEEEASEATVDDIAAEFTSEPDVPVETAPIQTIVERKGGFMPMLFGGLVAGGIGFGAAYYLLPQFGGQDIDAFRSDVTAKLDKNAGDIAGLSDSITQLPEATDTGALETQLSDLIAASSSLTNRLDSVESEFVALNDRLTTVEKRPISEGASDAAVAAYERELKALQDTMAAQRAEIEAMASDAQSMENNAEEIAKATMKRAALTRIQTALDTGTGFASALGDLQDAGVEVPTALNDVAEDGVPSLAQLQASFPEAARAALTVSRREAADSGETSGFTSFLKTQLGTRSLEPREGNDADAVLSRAEAAAREGRLTDALAEIEVLPEVGRAALSDWANQVNLRQGAVAATETLNQELN